MQADGVCLSDMYELSLGFHLSALLCLAAARF